MRGGLRRRVGWAIGVVVIAAVLLAVLIGRWANSTVQAPAQPVHYLRDAGGRMQASPEPQRPTGFHAQGRLKTIMLRVKSTGPQGGAPYQLAHAESQPEMRSFGDGGMNHFTSIDGVCSVEFHVQPPSGKARFRLTVEMRDAEPARSASPPYGSHSRGFSPSSLSWNRRTRTALLRPSS